MKHKAIHMVVPALGIATIALVACGSGPAASESPSLGGSPSISAAGSTGSASSTDPLVGVWNSAPFTLSDVEATLHGQFEDAAFHAMEPLHGCLPQEGETHVITLHFERGRSSSPKVRANGFECTLCFG